MQTALAAAPVASHTAAAVDSPSVVIATIFGLVALCQGSGLDWATSLRALREVVIASPGQRKQDVAMRILDAVLRHSRPQLAS